MNPPRHAEEQTMAEPITPRRVAVTGIGVLGTAGIGQQAFFDGLCAPAPKPPLTVDDFDPAPLFDSPKEMRRHDRFEHFALACAEEALAQAGDLNCDPTRIGVQIGCGIGGVGSFEPQLLINEKSPKQVSPFVLPMMMNNAATAAVSIRYGFQGPCDTISTACATGTQNIGRASHLIRWGKSDIMLAGGSEASNTPALAQGFTNMTALSSVGISRPFDIDRDGFLHAEGAGVLVLEAYDHAVARNATILAEILGYAGTSDAYHITVPLPDGAGAVACMELALQDAGITPDEIVHINAHGTSTPLNDANETAAISRLFGSPGPLVTSTKGVTGHAIGASGAMEAAAVILAMQHRLIPPTANYQTHDPGIAFIRVAAEPTEWEPGLSLSNSFGFGGHNAALVIAPPDDQYDDQ